MVLGNCAEIISARVRQFMVKTNAGKKLYLTPYNTRKCLMPEMLAWPFQMPAYPEYDTTPRPPGQFHDATRNVDEESRRHAPRPAPTEAPQLNLQLGRDPLGNQTLSISASPVKLSSRSEKREVDDVELDVYPPALRR